MDRNLHTDNFEKLLREKSEEFRMYPSKRIWHSIYNNIHPGRKWPSVAMSITLISSLFLIGYLNTKNSTLYKISGENFSHQVHSPTNPSLPGNITTIYQSVNGNESLPETLNRKTSTWPVNSHLKNTVNNAAKYASIAALTNVNLESANSTKKDLNIVNEPLVIIGPSHTKEIIIAGVAINSLQDLTEPSSTLGNKEKNTGGNDEYASFSNMQKTVVNDLLQNVLIQDYGSNEKYNKVNVPINSGNSYSYFEKNNFTSIKQDFISIEDREWIENYALYNRRPRKKWANKLSWQMYATPSVVYRTLYSDFAAGTALNAPPLAISASSQDINNAVIQKPSLGLEIGTDLQYSISKGIKLKAGIQLNYTRYNSHAFQNTHPVSTSLSMHDYTTNLSYEEFRTTPFSNKSGPEPIKLHNETFQISLPIGMDIKLAGTQNLQWGFGATIQPSYVPAGKSYLISSDRRYYVKETSMLNRFNLNAGFESFLSYKSNGITYQFGPQFRTQLFSTNSKKFAVGEKIVNYGLKLGISKTLK